MSSMAKKDSRLSLRPEGKFSIYPHLRLSSNQTDRQQIIPSNYKTDHILANMILLPDLWHTSAKGCTVPQKLMDRHNCRQVWSVW